jgi:hypothetical protein
MRLGCGSVALESPEPCRRALVARERRSAPRLPRQKRPAVCLSDIDQFVYEKSQVKRNIRLSTKFDAVETYSKYGFVYDLHINWRCHPPAPPLIRE